MRFQVGERVRIRNTSPMGAGWHGRLGVIQEITREPYSCKVLVDDDRQGDNLVPFNEDELDPALTGLDVMLELV